MTATPSRIPQATLREEWAAARVHHWARSVEVSAAPETGPPPGRPERGDRLTEALLRLASDPRATAHERALAAERVAQVLRRSA